MHGSGLGRSVFACPVRPALACVSRRFLHREGGLSLITMPSPLVGRSQIECELERSGDAFQRLASLKHLEGARHTISSTHHQPQQC